MIALPLAEIGYRIDTKCGGCVYNVHCQTESDRLRWPELLGIDPVSAHMSHAAGMRTLEDLARPPVFLPTDVEDLLRNPGFDENLEHSEVRAEALWHTLHAVRGAVAADEYKLVLIPNTGVGPSPPMGRRVTFAANLPDH